MDETAVAGLQICWAGNVMLHHRVIVRTNVSSALEPTIGKLVMFMGL